jgi:hypothetical protein
MFTDMVKIQNNHRHDKPPTMMYPETIGAMAGPANGATVRIDNAFPRICASHISETRALWKVNQHFG